MATSPRIRAMGIRDKPIAPGSPWQNGFAEKPIGSIRRECLDHLVIMREAHLRQILQNYADYYNKVRTHRSLGKEAPRFRPVQRFGNIALHAILGGLHHHYVRVYVFGAHNQDFHRNGVPTWQYASAGPGNVALIGALAKPSLSPT